MSLYRRYLLFILIHLILNLIICYFFYGTYELKKIVILYHLIIGGFGLGLVVILTATISSFVRKQKTIRRISVSIVWSSYFLIMFLVWLFSFIGKSHVGTILPIYFFKAQIFSLAPLLKNLEISIPLFYSILVLLPLLLFLNYYFLFSSLELGNELLKSKVKKTISQPLPSSGGFGYVIPMLLFIAGSFYSIHSHEAIIWTLLAAEEPISGVIYGGNYQGLRLANSNEEDNVNSTYSLNQDSKKRNVILVVFDALRADHMSLYGYERKTTPFLDSLHKKGKLHFPRQTIASASTSFQGILAILRSRGWRDIHLSDYAIQDLMADLGYQVHFILGGDHRSFFGLKSFYGKNLTSYVDGSMVPEYNINDDQLIFESLDKIDDYTGNPTFFYFHFLSTHGGGVIDTLFQIYEPTNHKFSNFEYYKNQYDNRIIQADAYLKKLLKQLQRKGYLNESIIIITSDHGESVGEKNKIGHASNLYFEQVNIPFIIMNPIDSSITELPEFAFQVDIAPTIADLLELNEVPSWKGRSVLRKNDLSRMEILEHAEYVAIITKNGHNWNKYIQNKNTGIEELYFLNEDLQEVNNQIETIPYDSLLHFRRIANLLSDPETLKLE